MQILDLRSRRVRRAERWWRRWQEAPPAPVRCLNAPTASLAQAGMALLRSRRGRPPARPLLVSIGNLVLGGTGKTPVVAQLARDLSDRGIDGAVLTRGYGAPERGPLLVTAADPRAGDEARLMAAALAGSGWSVVQARRRRSGLDWLLARDRSPRVVLIEDGHQTRGVPRHLDVLILDRWRLTDRDGTTQLVPEPGLVVPWGPYREPPAAAAAADVWLVEHSGPLPPRRHGSGPPSPRLYRFVRQAALPPVAAALLGGTGAAGTAGGPRQLPYATLAGIARPERFERDCLGLVGWPPALAVRYDDHARYRPSLLAPALAAAAERRIALWLTTAKDLIKLRPEAFTAPLGAVTQRLRWQGTETLPDLIEERLGAEDGRNR